MSHSPKRTKRTGRAARAVALCAPLALCAALLAGPAQAADYELRMPVQKTARMAAPGEADGKDAKPAKDARPQQDAPKAAPKSALARAAEAAANSAAPPQETSASLNATAPKPAKKHAPATAHPQEHAAPAASAAGGEAPAHAGGRTVVSAGAPIPVKIPSGPATAAEQSPGKSADQAAEQSPGKPAPQPAPVAKAKPTAKPAAQPADKPAPKPEARPAPKPEAKPAAKVDPKALQMPAPAPAAAPVALPAQGLWVGGVEVEYRESAVLLRLATTGPVERVTWFNVAEPRRLACDLRGQWRKKGPAVIRFETGPVKHIIVGEHPDRLRLSLEFREGAVAPVIEPKIEQGERTLSLTIPLAVKLAR